MNDGSKETAESQVGVPRPPKSNKGYELLHLPDPVSPPRCDYIKTRFMGQYLDEEEFVSRAEGWKAQWEGSKNGWVASSVDPEFVVGRNGSRQRDRKLCTFRSALYGEVLCAQPGKAKNYPIWTEVKGKQCMYYGADDAHKRLLGLVDGLFTRTEEKIKRVDYCIDFKHRDLVSELWKSVDLGWVSGMQPEPSLEGNGGNGRTIYINGKGWTIRLYEKGVGIAYGERNGKRLGSPAEAELQCEQVFGDGSNWESWCRAEVEWRDEYLCGKTGAFLAATKEQADAGMGRIMKHCLNQKGILASPRVEGHSERNVEHPYWSDIKKVFLSGYAYEPPLRQHMPPGRMNTTDRIRRAYGSLRKLFIESYDGPSSEMSVRDVERRMLSMFREGFLLADQDNQEIYRLEADMNAYRAEYGQVREEDFYDDF